MTDGETHWLSMMETLLDRKLGDIVTKVLCTAVAEQFNGLRDEIAALKQEFILTSAANLQKQTECQASIEALTSLLPGSHPSTQNSGTTLSTAAEHRSQPIPDADFEAYWNPTRPSDGAFGFEDDVAIFNENEDWTYRVAIAEHSPSHLQAAAFPVMSVPLPGNSAAIMSPNGVGWQRDDAAGREPAIGMQQPGTYPEQPQAAMSRLMPYPQQQTGPNGQQSALEYLTDRKSPALHRKHNPKSCMVCRGSFRKLSSCKEHMLKCLKPNSGCRFLPNYAHHQQLIRPFTGPDVEARWVTAITEWIHRKE
jgi:hypothetical protein